MSSLPMEAAISTPPRGSGEGEEAPVPSSSEAGEYTPPVEYMPPVERKLGFEQETAGIE